VTLGTGAPISRVARAISDAARWVGLERVVVEEVYPAQAADKIRLALRSSWIN
jgi:hypothetical protein